MCESCNVDKMCESCNAENDDIVMEIPERRIRRTIFFFFICNIYENIYKIQDYIMNYKNKKIIKRCLKSKSNLIQHAISEFKIAGWMDKNNKFVDDMQELICANVLEALEIFSKQGHSGSSANYAISLFKELASYNIITPLTGEDSEWCDLGDSLYQNIRCSHVFKDHGFTYDIDGRIFSENGEKNNTFTAGKASRVFVTFPYRPVKEYVHLDGELTDELREQYKNQELEKWEEYIYSYKNNTSE